MFRNQRGCKILAALAQGKSFKIFLDSKPLEKLNIKARTDEELGDLTFYLSQYDMEMIYHPGENN